MFIHIPLKRSKNFIPVPAVPAELPHVQRLSMLMGSFVSREFSTRSMDYASNSRLAMKYLLMYLIESRLNIPAENFHANHFFGLQEWLSKRATSARTRLSFYGKLRAFFDYLIDHEGVLASNPALGLKERRPKAALRRAISIKQVWALFSAIEHASPNGPTLRFLFEVQYSTVARIGEVLKLRRKDIILPVNDSEPVKVLLMSKNNRERIGYIPARLRARLDGHMKTYRISNGNDLLFPSKAGSKYTIDQSNTTKLLTSLLPKVGVHREMGGTHVFRHSAAQHMLDRGADLGEISRLMVHSDLTTTSIYAMHKPEKIFRELRKRLPDLYSRKLSAALRSRTLSGHSRNIDNYPDGPGNRMKLTLQKLPRKRGATRV